MRYLLIAILCLSATGCHVFRHRSCDPHIDLHLRFWRGHLRIVEIDSPIDLLPGCRPIDTQESQYGACCVTEKAKIYCRPVDENEKKCPDPGSCEKPEPEESGGIIFKGSGPLILYCNGEPCELQPLAPGDVGLDQAIDDAAEQTNRMLTP